MMANKWVQAVLIGGIGFGMLIGAMTSVIVGPIAVFVAGWVVMMISMWKAANCRGTDGWGGPYHGPKGPQ